MALRGGLGTSEAQDLIAGLEAIADELSLLHSSPARGEGEDDEGDPSGAAALAWSPGRPDAAAAWGRAARPRVAEVADQPDEGDSSSSSASSPPDASGSDSPLSSLSDSDAGVFDAGSWHEGLLARIGNLQMKAAWDTVAALQAISRKRPSSLEDDDTFVQEAGLLEVDHGTEGRQMSKARADIDREIDEAQLRTCSWVGRFADSLQHTARSIEDHARRRPKKAGFSFDNMPQARSRRFSELPGPAEEGPGQGSSPSRAPKQQTEAAALLRHISEQQNQIASLQVSVSLARSELDLHSKAHAYVWNTLETDAEAALSDEIKNVVMERLQAAQHRQSRQQQESRAARWEASLAFGRRRSSREIDVDFTGDGDTKALQFYVDYLRRVVQDHDAQMPPGRGAAAAAGSRAGRQPPPPRRRRAAPLGRPGPPAAEARRGGGAEEAAGEAAAGEAAAGEADALEGRRRRALEGLGELRALEQGAAGVLRGMAEERGRLRAALGEAAEISARLEEHEHRVASGRHRSQSPARGRPCSAAPAREQAAAAGEPAVGGSRPVSAQEGAVAGASGEYNACAGEIAAALAGRPPESAGAGQEVIAQQLLELERMEAARRRLQTTWVRLRSQSAAFSLAGGGKDPQQYQPRLQRAAWQGAESAQAPSRCEPGGPAGREGRGGAGAVGGGAAGELEPQGGAAPARGARGGGGRGGRRVSFAAGAPGCGESGDPLRRDAISFGSEFQGLLGGDLALGTGDKLWERRRKSMAERLRRLSEIQGPPEMISQLLKKQGENIQLSTQLRNYEYLINKMRKNIPLTNRDLRLIEAMLNLDDCGSAELKEDVAAARRRVRHLQRVLREKRQAWRSTDGVMQLLRGKSVKVLTHASREQERVGAAKANSAAQWLQGVAAPGPPRRSAPFGREREAGEVLRTLRGLGPSPASVVERHRSILLRRSSALPASWAGPLALPASGAPHASPSTMMVPLAEEAAAPRRPRATFRAVQRAARAALAWRRGASAARPPSAQARGGLQLAGLGGGPGGGGRGQQPVEGAGGRRQTQGEARAGPTPFAAAAAARATAAAGGDAPSGPFSAAPALAAAARSADPAAQRQGKPSRQQALQQALKEVMWEL